jgi:hypothetical protein
MIKCKTNGFMYQKTNQKKNKTKKTMKQTYISYLLANTQTQKCLAQRRAVRAFILAAFDSLESEPIRKAKALTCADHQSTVKLMIIE